MAADAPPPGGEEREAPPEPIRVDKWLWHARFAKSRGVAARLVSEAGLRVNGTRTTKPSAQVRPGDVLTFALGDHVRVVRLVSPGARRGPAPEARLLYEDLAPPAARTAPDPATRPPAPRDPGSGRPSKAERRALDRLRAGRDD